MLRRPSRRSADRPAAASVRCALGSAHDDPSGRLHSLLVTNDFPPKVGGIQSYLWELWRRLPSPLAGAGGEGSRDAVGVLTTHWEDAEAWDDGQTFRIERTRERVLLPTPGLARRVRDLASEWRAGLVFLDPVLPLGAIGPRLHRPYVVIVHGAEVTVYRRFPGPAAVMSRVLRRAEGIVAAGSYPARQACQAARRPLRGLVIPPGVDTDRFHPEPSDRRDEVRARYGLDPARPMVLGLSRLVPRKGFDVLIRAVAGLAPEVQLAIGGGGRDRGRLASLAERHGIADRTHFLGRVNDDDLPGLYAAADVFAMLCRDRWGGLEAEGFGIVFLEAAACGVPAVAGRSGGSHEAVADGETGFVVDPTNVEEVRERLAALLAAPDLRRTLGENARRRAQAEFSYDRLAAQLAPLAAGDLSTLGPINFDG